MNILTNDPSITAWGWAVVDTDGDIKQAGCIKTEPDKKVKNLRKSDDRARRASEITKTLIEMIKTYDVQYVLSEAPHGSQSAISASMMGMVTGMLIGLTDALDIPVEWYSEGEVKHFLLKKRSAAKQEMIDKIKLFIEYAALLSDGPVFTGTRYKDEAIADALGVYLTAMGKSQTLRLAKRTT